MHRYDAVFQILVGSWTHPGHHHHLADGNALCWSDVLPFRRESSLPDNFGTSWASGVYGGSGIGHVQGAWQVACLVGCEGSDENFGADLSAFWQHHLPRACIPVLH